MFKSFIRSIKCDLQNRQDGYTGFVRVQITNLTPGVKEIVVHHKETHEIDQRNMVDISGKFPIIHNYTKNVPTLGGKQEEILDPVQLKFWAMWCAKDWTIETIQKKFAYSYRQARKIKQYQKQIIFGSGDSEQSYKDALYFLDLHFPCELKI